MEERKKIIDNIIEITDENNNILKDPDILLDFSCNKYSSKKNSIYHITLNGKHLSKKNNHRIKYKCCSCENIHIIGVTQFLRKVNKCSYRCNLCCNKDDVKRQNHRCYFQNIETDNKNVVTQKSLIDQKIESEKLFEEYDDDFKINYFRNHLTLEDYNRISSNVMGIQNGNIALANLEYWPIFKTNNQMLFSGIFYDKVNDIIVRGNQPVMKCENCQNIWRAKQLHKFKNCHRILCNNCTLCNKTFKIRLMKNIINEPIIYQSQLELKFISWCANNNIILKNGPTILYMFENKQRKYRVDFQIGEILIEIKDNHIWHRNQVESGLWKAKELAIQQEIENKKYKYYYVIMPKNWICSLNNIKMLTK